MSIKRLVTHYLIPHESNNQKAKLLHSSSILAIAVVLLIYQIGLFILPKSGVQILGYAANISVDEVVRLTNEKRAQAGLNPLEFNPSLASAAKAKGEDMLARDYWAHVAPDGTEPWKFFTGAGYKYRFAGENLARDFSNAVSAVEAWMASPTHKENVLSAKYREIGIAVVEGDLAGADTTLIVQLFGTRQADTLPAEPLAQKAVSTAAPVVGVTPSPASAIAAAVPTRAPEVLVQGPLAGEPPSGGAPGVLISPFNTTKGLSLSVVGILLIVLMLDGVLTSRRRIARIGGRAFAHISFLGMILAITLILQAGQIL